MSLANKTFKNNRTGQTVKVLDSFENIVILDDKSRIDANKLLDPNLFTELIDPSSFFETHVPYDMIAEKIKSIPLDNVPDDDTNEIRVNVAGDDFAPATSESAAFYTTEDDERAELARKYGIENNKNDELQRQNEAFNKLLNEEETPKTNNVPQNDIKITRATHNDIKVMAPPIPAEDPIVAMFKNVKRVKDFSINLEIKNKIPRLDFIEMMEDSYNVSIIDFLASEFTNNLLQNPQVIEDMIRDKIKEMVYGLNENQDSSKTKNIVIPSVPKEDRAQLSEGGEEKPKKIVKKRQPKKQSDVK